MKLLILVLTLATAPAFADMPFSIISCAGDVAVSTTPVTINVDTRGPQTQLKAATVKVYITFSGTAVVGSGHSEQIGENEILTSTGPTMSLVAASSGTINVCWGTGS